MKAFFQNKMTCLILMTFAVLVNFISCDGIFSNDDGNIIRKEINPDYFSQIRIYGIYRIILIQDTIHRVIIEGSEDCIADTEVRVDDDTLIIQDIHKDLFRIEKIPALYIHFTDIRYLWTINPVEVTNEDTLKLDWFYFYPVGEICEAQLTLQCGFFGMDNSANTLGRFSIRGSAQTAKFYNRYGSSVYADSLKSRVVHVYNESIGDVRVHADDLLQVFIWGPGNIYYAGDPYVQIMEKKSTGQVFKL